MALNLSITFYLIKFIKMDNFHSEKSPTKKSQIGWALYDWASSPVPTLHATFIFAVYFTTQVAVLILLNAFGVF